MRVIRGKVAVVTGAGSGFGKAIALRLAREGANLHLLDINLPAAVVVAEEASQLGVLAVAVQCDVADRAALERAACELVDRWGGVDILVNCAGICWYGLSEYMSGDEWERLLAINLHAPIHLSRQLIPHFLERPEAHIINMSSIAGWVCGARTTAYHVSKFGLVGFSEALRAEYLRRHIGVTAVCPGPALTKLYENSTCGYADRKMPMPPAWICTTPEVVAEATLRAIYRNQAVAIVSPMAWGLYYLKRLAPWFFNILHHFGIKRPAQRPIALRPRELRQPAFSAREAA